MKYSELLGLKKKRKKERRRCVRESKSNVSVSVNAINFRRANPTRYHLCFSIFPRLKIPALYFKHRALVFLSWSNGNNEQSPCSSSVSFHKKRDTENFHPYFVSKTDFTYPSDSDFYRYHPAIKRKLHAWNQTTRMHNTIVNALSFDSPFVDARLF